MMKLTMLSILALTIGLRAAAAEAPPDCALDLGVPARYADYFERYARNDYVTPLRATGADRVGSAFELRLSTPPPEPPGEEGWRPHHARVIGSYEEFEDRHLRIEGVDLSPDLPPRFAYRVIFAHLLDTFTEAERITIDVFETPAAGAVRDGLVEGASVEMAWRYSALGLIAEEFGWRVVSADATPAPVKTRAYVGQADVSVTLRRRSVEPLGQ